MRPPAWLTGLARTILPSRDREVVLGDLDELYARRRAERGRLRADLDYLRAALASAWHLRTGRRAADANRRTAQWIAAAGQLPSDARAAIRSLRRRPGFTLMVVGTLALGIGSVTAVFGMVNQLILRPLPGVENFHRAAYLRMDPDGRESLTLREFDELARRATLLEGIASYGLTTQNVSLGSGRPISVWGGTFYGDFFEVLGLEAAEGRILSGAESDLDADPLVTVISASLRERLFGSEPGVVGRTIQMNGHPVEIVGVAPAGFQGAERGVVIDAWLPHSALVPLVGFTRDRLTSPNSAMHGSLVILPRPGVTLGAVEDQVTQILTQIAEADPETAEHLGGMRPVAYPGLQTPPLMRDVTSRTLGMMTWAVALILAIAVANVANLLLFQNLARRGVLATVRALGASTGRIARQHIAESLALGCAGAVAGLVVAWLLTLAFRGESLVRMPAFEGFGLDARTGAFVIVTALATSLTFGVVPAVLAGRFDLGATLRASGSRETGRVGALRSALTAGQIGLTLALIVGGLLMVRTIANLRSLDTGLDIDRVATLYLRLSPDLGPDEAHDLQRHLVEETEAIPGVGRTALDVYGPHGSSFRTPVALPGQMQPLGRNYDMSSLAVGWQVTPGWFELFGVEPIHGRVFEDADWRVPPTDAAVVTASLARRVFGRTDVVGRVVSVRVSREPEERTIVGVVGDYTSLASPAEPTDAIFLPYGAIQTFQLTVMAKISPSSPDALPQMRRVAESLFPDVPVPEPGFLSERVEDIHREERLLGRLLGILSSFGVLLSAVGLFGAVFFIVNHRMREFGIRRALGADAAGIVGLIARATLLMVTTGALLGLVAAYALSRVLESRLFGVGSFDPVAYLGAAGVVLLAAVLACLAPMRVALESDPVAVLREQ